MGSTPTMSAAQLTQKLVALKRDYAHYRVEMALYVDKLERRLEEVEKGLRRVPLRADVGGSYMPYHNTVAGFSEHRPNHRALPPISTTPGNFPAPAPSSSPFVHTPAYPGTQYDGLQHPPRDGAGPPGYMGSGENAAFLPYAIEKIAAASQKKTDGDRRTCACGRPTFDMKCFREHHFDWCRLHQRAVIQGHYNCSGRDHRDCQAVRWEKHPDWKRIVKGSFDSGNFGYKKVKDLYELLFPIEEFPDKYEGGWYVG